MDESFLQKLIEYKMPFGNFQGCLIIDLPEHYLVWYHEKGFPPGELGEMMASVYEIKLNGLEYLFKPLRKTEF